MSEAEQIAAATRAVQLLVKERARQIDVEGFATTHDDEHTDGSIAAAAASYAMFAANVAQSREWRQAPVSWPWEASSWKVEEGDAKSALVKAGALILAELERLERAEHGG